MRGRTPKMTLICRGIFGSGPSFLHWRLTREVPSTCHGTFLFSLSCPSPVPLTLCTYCKCVTFIFSVLFVTHIHTTVLQPSWIFFRTTWVSWHQKGKSRKVKPIWIYWSKRQWQWHLLGHMHPTAQFFTGRIPFRLPNQQRESTEGNLFVI